MNVFDIVGESYFTVLSSKNRKIYLDSILYLNGLINDLFEANENDKEKIVELLASHLNEKYSIKIIDEYTDDEVENINNNTDKARYIINVLINYGWLIEESVSNGKKALDFTDYSYRFIDLIKEIALNNKPSYTSHIKIIKNELDNFKVNDVDSLDIINRELKSFVSSLRGLHSSLQRFYKHITNNKTKEDLVNLLIVYNLFKNCKSLTSIIMPDSVETIGRDAFYNCTSLTHVITSKALTSIPKYTFENCENLTSIDLSKSTNLKSIGDQAFNNCRNLTSIEIPNSVTSIGNTVFGKCAKLSNVVLSNKLTSIGSNVFWKCSSLKEIIIPSGITNIAYGLFSDCTSLTNVLIPNSITTISDYAFINCTSLTSITLPNTLNTIGVRAFDNCLSLTSIIIPSSVTSINTLAFFNCTNLKTIYCEASEKPVGWFNDWLGYSNPEVIWGYKPKQ